MVSQYKALVIYPFRALFAKQIENNNLTYYLAVDVKNYDCQNRCNRLGKTLQSISFIAHLLHVMHEPGPHLVHILPHISRSLSVVLASFLIMNFWCARTIIFTIAFFSMSLFCSFTEIAFFTVIAYVFLLPNPIRWSCLSRSSSTGW